MDNSQHQIDMQVRQIKQFNQNLGWGECAIYHKQEKKIKISGAYRICSSLQSDMITPFTTPISIHIIKKQGQE